MPKLPATKKKSAKSSPTKAAIDPRYPIGPQPASDKTITPANLKHAIKTIESFPKHLHKAVHKLKDKKLDTPYREGGWTVRQLVHHIADSHSTALFRIHKALTEDAPTVPGYPEQLLAHLADYTGPIDASLAILEGTHARWALLLQSLKPKDFTRTYVHAERGPQTIAQATLLYEWHSKHHLAHITNLRKQKGW